MEGKKKVIIDSDPGIDDAFAVLLALSASPELEVVALTSSFGNVETKRATKNLEVLLELASRRGEVVVAEGCERCLRGRKPRVADFVHGVDGFGETMVTEDDGEDDDDNDNDDEDNEQSSSNASKLIAEMARKYPKEITVICLATATNIVKAFREDDECARNLKAVVHLGGAYYVCGNVNPAAEANVYADCLAADELYGTEEVDIYAIGLDVTLNIRMTEEKLLEMSRTKSKEDGTKITNAERAFLVDAAQFYMKYHVESMNFRGILQHDAVCVFSVINPELFEWTQGRVRVATDGVAKGKTIIDSSDKKWFFDNSWTERPLINVALSANHETIEKQLLERFI